MLPVAEEEMLSPLAPSRAWGEERVFSFAAGVGLAALETHQGANTTRAKKPHQGIFSENRRLRFSAMWAKWSGTHQDRSGSWWKSVLGSALDANGNTLSDPSGKQYTWDVENRLTSVVVPSIGTVNFKYDPFGGRIEKQSPSFTSIFIYDGDNLLETLNASGSEVASYTQTQKIDEKLAELRGSTTDYYEVDGLRSITSLSTSAAALANTYTYDSFGNTTSSTGTLSNYFRYAGREFDSETGVYFNRARYYDSQIGRFISEDPLRGISGSINFYPYVANSPINLIDPSGLCPCDGTPRFRLVPYSDCSHRGYRQIYYELTGPGASGWWVTEHQNPTSWAPPTGQSTGDAAGGFNDTIYGTGVANSYQNFTVSPQDPTKFPGTPSCPVDVQLPSGPNGSPQDYRTLGLWHGGTRGYTFINGNSTGWVPCNPSFDQPGIQ